MIRVDGWKFRRKDNHDVAYTIHSKRELGGLEWIWYSKTGEEMDLMYSATSESFLRYAEPMPEFFERDKTYQHTGTGTKWTVWYVHKMANGPVAVVQNTGGVPGMLVRRDWDSDMYVEV